MCITASGVRVCVCASVAVAETVVAAEYAGRVHILLYIHPRRMETNNTVRCRWALKKPILSVRHVRIYTLYYVPSRALTVTAAFVTALFTLNRRPDAHGLMGHTKPNLIDTRRPLLPGDTPRSLLYYAATFLPSTVCYCVYRQLEKK